MIKNHQPDLRPLPFSNSSNTKQRPEFAFSVQSCSSSRRSGWASSTRSPTRSRTGNTNFHHPFLPPRYLTFWIGWIFDSLTLLNQSCLPEVEVLGHHEVLQCCPHPPCPPPPYIRKIYPDVFISTWYSEYLSWYFFSPPAPRGPLGLSPLDPRVHFHRPFNESFILCRINNLNV